MITDQWDREPTSAGRRFTSWVWARSRFRVRDHLFSSSLHGFPPPPGVLAESQVDFLKPGWNKQWQLRLDLVVPFQKFRFWLIIMESEFWAACCFDGHKRAANVEKKSCMNPIGHEEMNVFFSELRFFLNGTPEHVEEKRLAAVKRSVWLVLYWLFMKKFIYNWSLTCNCDLLPFSNFMHTFIFLPWSEAITFPSLSSWSCLFICRLRVDLWFTDWSWTASIYIHTFFLFMRPLVMKLQLGENDWMTWLIASVHAGPTVRELWFADISDRKFTRHFKCLRNISFPLWRTHRGEDGMFGNVWMKFISTRKLGKCRQRKCHLKALQFLWAQSRRLVEGKELKCKNFMDSRKKCDQRRIDGN